MERDRVMNSSNNIYLISTHTLTWSVTNTALRISLRYDISTHTLTWSVTIYTSVNYFLCSNFNSHAHVERDWKDFDFTLNKLNFNSHAHVERDNNFIVKSYKYSISTHTLTWSVTSGSISIKTAEAFQLTRSRGA